MAAQTTLELCSSMGIRNFILEGDALEVIRALHQEGTCRGTYRQLISDVQSLLSRGHTWQVKHIWQKENVAAH
jgi:hypothetical protein